MREIKRNGGTLRVWEPGESGNPKGRPPDTVRMLKALLATEPDVVKIAAQTWRAVLTDSDHKHWPTAFKEFIARTDGPATEGGDSVSLAEVKRILGVAFEVIGEELDGPDAERVVRAILDRLEGSRTVQAEVVERDD